MTDEPPPPVRAPGAGRRVDLETARRHHAVFVLQAEGCSKGEALRRVALAELWDASRDPDHLTDAEHGQLDARVDLLKKAVRRFAEYCGDEDVYAGPWAPGSITNADEAPPSCRCDGGRSHVHCPGCRAILEFERPLVGSLLNDALIPEYPGLLTCSTECYARAAAALGQLLAGDADPNSRGARVREMMEQARPQAAPRT